MRDLGIEGVDLVSLAKSRELGNGDRAAPAAKSPERVFLLHRKDPLVLPQSSPELFMLTRIRDEAHRFAITFQKDLMRRRNFQSVLEEIPGVGEVRKKALLRHFGSLKRVRGATIEELSSVDGLGAEIAERIHTYLHGTAAELRAQSIEDATGDAVRSASLEDASAPPEQAV
jgi:excinuclease ABC subunit C